MQLEVDVVATGAIPPSVCGTPLEASFETPCWASKPRWETNLERVGPDWSPEDDIDISKAAMLRVGRSLSSCVQLPDITVSRKHAIIVHHACGDTYIVDVGSAHGTYVNNIKIMANVPHKLRRGSLIRFGGDSAPLFLFKAFERIERLLEDIDGLCDRSSSSNDSEDVKVVCGNSGVVCVSCDNTGSISKQEASLAAQTLVNTLLNAGGGKGMVACGEGNPARRFMWEGGCIGEVEGISGVDGHVYGRVETSNKTETRKNNKRRGITDCVDGESSYDNNNNNSNNKNNNNKNKNKNNNINDGATVVDHTSACLGGRQKKRFKVSFSTAPPQVCPSTCITPEESEESEDGSESGDSLDDTITTENTSPRIEDEPTPPPSPPQLPLDEKEKR